MVLQVFIEHFLRHRTKAEIVRLGVELGAPLYLSWSCYREGPVP